ncbi:MAG: metalloregulator ArsR/SmtB family transcription factor [Candidatus Spechtbacterales bacterium]
MVNKIKSISNEQALLKKARLFAIVGDDTRIKILCFLFESKEPCVSEISSKIDATIANTSHHLQLMHREGLLATERKGNNICYKLVKNEFTKELKKIICDVEFK